MIYKLKNEVDSRLSATEQILVNRGIRQSDVKHYLNTTDKDINSPLAFGEDVMRRAATTLIQTIQNEDLILVVVDADCDGYTSSALLINYLYDLFPSYVENKLHWFLHEGKQHGLSDVVVGSNYKLVICPDAASNDYSEHLELINRGIPVLILDHHEAEITSPNAIVINNQLSKYPNKSLSGVGVTWQFCRYLDSLLGKNYADNYLDLVALGNMADMMDMTQFETKHLITIGFKDENIKNPFIHGMAKKNAYSLGNKITPMGAAFYIAPFVNAMVRSGKAEEKELLFKSMIKFLAFQQVPSTKRGHDFGEMETIVDQALRTATNVKNRQKKIEDEAIERLEKLIKTHNLLSHKVLLFLLAPGQVDKNVAGLIANKFMAKYQRPCCILTRITEMKQKADSYDLDKRITWTEVSYQGSARGCDLAGVSNFKDICEQTGLILYAQGHQGAFGLGISEKNINVFLEKTDEILKDMPNEPIYYVDYIYEGGNVKPQDILDIAFLDDLWGTGMPEPFIAIRGLRINKDMVTVYSKKDLTLKITLPNKLSLIMFKAPEDLCDKLQNQNPGTYTFDIVGTCNANEWCGNITPQLFIEDYNITGQQKYLF